MSPRPVSSERRYAEWKPGYSGPPPIIAPYYGIALACGVYALAIAFFLKFAAILMLPLQAVGQAIRLYSPIVRRRVEPLRDLPTSEVQYAVRFNLAREAFYASDEGLASFVDGWLVIQAAGCAFSLRTSDMTRYGIERPEFSFQGPAGEYHLSFFVFEKGFKQTWIQWKSSPAPAQGVPVFPPVQPLPCRNGRLHLFFAILLGFGAFAIPLHSPFALSILLATGIVSMALTFAMFRRADLARNRIALGKLRRRSAWTVLSPSYPIERLGEAFAADQRRRRRRKELAARRDIVLTALPMSDALPEK